MNARWIVLPVALAALAAALRAAAIDAPHDASFATGECTACHSLHNATGAGLTNQPTNFTLCAGCHDLSPTGGRLGFPWGTADQATPGSGGSHHHWDSPANNPAYGATAPAPISEMGKRVKNGYLQCSTCHDQHAATMANGGTQHTSIPVAVAQVNVSGSGNCQLALDQPTATAAARGYLIDMVQAGTAGAAGTALFRFSNDNGTSWFGSGGAPYSGSNGIQARQNVQLNDGANLTVTFSQVGAPTCQVGDRWKFYVSYPFLRVSNANSAMCETCHPSRVMNHVAVEGPGDGTTVFSHPVGVALNANGKNYDRAANALLDANGVLQTTGDGNSTNNLTLGTGSTVRCMTCHYPHNADSNSLTVDVR